MKKSSVFGFVIGILFLSVVVAAEDIQISSEDLETGVTLELTTSDKVYFPVGDSTEYISVIDISSDSAELFVHTQKNTQEFFGENHPSNAANIPSERMFEMNHDSYYDIKITFLSSSLESDPEILTIKIESTNEIVPEGAEIYYDCWDYFECSDGTKIQKCAYDSNGRCGCRSISLSECPSSNSGLANQVKSNLQERQELREAVQENVQERQQLVAELKSNIRERIKNGEELTLAEKKIVLRRINNEIMEMKATRARIATRLNLSEDEVNASIIKARLSNGRFAIIKVMPETASEKALERLRLKRCNNSSVNCTIELKEVGFGNQSKLAYEARARKTFKILGLIKAKRNILTQIDAETGEVIRTNRPWWSFLASEEDEAEETEEQEETLEEPENNSA